MLARVVALAVLGAFVLLEAAACGTDPAGVDACQRIEKARCESAQACKIRLDVPQHEGETPGENVAACTRYYQDQCLHGLSSGLNPSSTQVDACVNAIIDGDCTTVSTPQSNAACSFLAPAKTTAADASTDG